MRALILALVLALAGAPALAQTAPAPNSAPALKHVAASISGPSGSLPLILELRGGGPQIKRTFILTINAQ